ncbi:AT-hook motif nuclear-localized protein 1-like [Cannabis sativa]|uniref:AT-hook motif nuclear-localized protein 1-like n=1 Tax=Cannabis sativa TaxID=3483 RepID=UPI0011DF958A|nr:AT-hook motif nuclear-localized protein 1-like [Cannabis sativa]
MDSSSSRINEDEIMNSWSRDKPMEQEEQLPKDKGTKALKPLSPQVVTVNLGEDIVTKIKTLASTFDSLTILSAYGLVSFANILYNISDQVEAHQGLFQILSLTCSMEGGEEITVNVSLSDPKSKFKVFGGVAQVLIPTQLALPFLANLRQRA